MNNDRELNCCFTRNGNRFRYRVGAIIIEDGCVLLAANETCSYYYSVGGGVHMGEFAEQAAEREALEETGVPYTVDRLAFVHENFFTDDESSLKGLNCHEISFYYIMKPRGTKNIPNIVGECDDGKEHVEFVPLDKLKELRVFPEFFKDRLESLPQSVEHIVTKEN